MKPNDKIRCRIAACPESMGDGKEWSFYLINEGIALDRVVLKTFGREWGDFGDSSEPNLEFQCIASGSQVLIWRDNDEEMNMWIRLLLRACHREIELLFEFPKLYRRKHDLPPVAGLARPGFAIEQEER